MEEQKSFRHYFPLLLPLFALLLAGSLTYLRGPAQQWILNHYRACEQDPILLELNVGYTVNRLLYASIFIIPSVYAAIYGLSLLLAKLCALFLKRKEALEAEPGKERSRQDALQARKIWRAAHMISAVCLIIAILCSRQVLYDSYAGPAQNVRVARDAFQRDLANYRAGRLASYQGPLTVEGYRSPKRSLRGNG